jgi:hypothetical protein
MFEERASAERSLELAAAIVRTYAGAPVGAPAVIGGTVKIHAVCGL